MIIDLTVVIVGVFKGGEVGSALLQNSLPPPRKIETPLLRGIMYVVLIKLFRHLENLSILLKS